MKKIIIALIALFSFVNSFGQSDDTTQYTYYRNVYGNRTDRVWGNKVLRAPLDTIYSKSGLAILNGTLYVGNGILWSHETGGGGSTDTTSLSNRINTKRDITDTSYAHKLQTRERGQQIADSLGAVKVTNFAASSFLGYGTYAAKPTSGSGFYYAQDSGRLAYINAGTLVWITDKANQKANIYFRGKGQPGDTGYVYGRDSSIYVRAKRDSGGYHHSILPDSSEVDWSLDSTGINALNTKYDDDTARIRQDAALATKMINFGGAPGQLQGTYAGIPAATGYATGTTYIAQDSGFQYVDTGSGGSRGWKLMTKGGGGGGMTPPAGSDGQVQINNSGAFGVVANLKVNKTTGTLNSDSSRTHLDYIDSSKYTNLGGLLYATSMSTFDNSIGVGYPYTDTTIRWSYQLASKVLHVQEKNYSVSSTGVATAIAKMNANVNSGHSTFTNFGGEFNDVRQNGLPRPTSQKVLNAMKAAIANQFAKKQVPAGSTGLGVTRYGTWTTPWDATLQSGKFINASYTSTANDSLVYQFTDSTVFLVPIGNSGLNGYTGSAFSVYIDNVLQFSGTTVQQSDGKVDVSSYSNDCIDMAFFITGLTNAAHTLKIVKTGSGLFIMDYVGNLVDRSKAYPIMFIQATHMNSTGYATAPANSTLVLQDTLNNRIDSLRAQTLAGYPILVSHVNTYFNTTTDLYTDGIHPDTLGYYHHYQADSLAVVNYISTPVAPGMVYYTRNGLHVRRTDNTDARIMTAEDSTGIMNQTAYSQTGGFNVLNHSYVGDKLSANLVDIGGTIASEKNARMTMGWNQFGNLVSFYDPTGAANQKLIDFYKPYGSASLQFRAVLDNEVSANTFLQFNYGSGNAILNAQFNSTIRANTTSGNGIDIVPYAGEIGVNASSFVVSGTYQHMAANGSASSGLQYYLKNTSSASGAYANGYFESNGTTGGSAALLTFRNTVWGKDYYFGLDPTDSTFKIATGNNVLFGVGSTPLFKIDRLGKHYMLQTPATGSSGDSVVVRVAGTGELKWVAQSSIGGGSSMPFSTITTTGSAPSFSLGGAVPTGGGGATSSMGPGSNLIKGSFQFTSGTGTGSGSTVATFTMPTSTTYVVVLQPTSPTIAHVYVQHTSGTTWTVILQGTDTIAASTNYSWDYIIMQ